MTRACGYPRDVPRTKDPNEPPSCTGPIAGPEVRTQLSRAALALVEQGGVSAVTFRAVNERAGLAATTAASHFTSVDDLLEATLRYCDDISAEDLARCECDPNPIGAFAYWLVGSLTEERIRSIAEYELFLCAARRPAMMPTARRWLTSLGALVDTWTESRRAARTICAFIDGLVLQSLISGEVPEPGAVEETIRSLL